MPLTLARYVLAGTFTAFLASQSALAQPTNDSATGGITPPSGSGGIYQSGDYNDDSGDQKKDEIAERYRQMDRAQRDRRLRNEERMNEWRKHHIKPEEKKHVTTPPAPKAWHPRPAPPLPEAWRHPSLTGDNLRDKDEHGNCRYTNHGWVCKGDDESTPEQGHENDPEYKKMLEECRNVQNHPQVIRDGNRWACNHHGTQDGHQPDDQSPHGLLPDEAPPYDKLPYEKPCLRSSLGMNDHCNSRRHSPPVYICRNQSSDTPYLLTEADYNGTNAARKRLCKRYIYRPGGGAHQDNAYFHSGGGGTTATPPASSSPAPAPQPSHPSAVVPIRKALPPAPPTIRRPEALRAPVESETRTPAPSPVRRSGPQTLTAD
ncbi:MAG: hypothetical protein J0L97_01880 [Alphaproteobacteria bacterium]|nr:hypothetical protein [Alphaproteobacteria bacterium]